MAYVLKSDLVGLIPDQFLTQALDDDGDGVADAAVWTAVATQAQDQVDGPLSKRYAVPFADPLPAIIRTAAKIFACSILYQRRGMTPENNPWHAKEKAMLEQLMRIGNGAEALTATTAPAKQPILIISEPAKTHSSSGKMLT